MIRFSCPTCRQILQAPDREAGNKLTCARCGQRLKVPPAPPPTPHTVLGTPIPAPTPHTVLGAPAQPLPDWVNDIATDPASNIPPGPPFRPVRFAQANEAPPVQRTSSESVATKCPGCGRSIRLAPHELSLTIVCARCDTSFVPVPPRQELPSPPEQEAAPTLFPRYAAESPPRREGGSGAVCQRWQRGLLEFLAGAVGFGTFGFILLAINVRALHGDPNPWLVLVPVMIAALIWAVSLPCPHCGSRVGRRWLHPRKDGGADLRYKVNYRLCKQCGQPWA